jgi:hypothetical protein
MSPLLTDQFGYLKVWKGARKVGAGCKESYRSGSLKIAARNVAEYRFDLMEYTRSAGSRVATNKQRIARCPWERK